MIIILTGPLGSGKSTALEFFTQKGFTPRTFSSFLTQEVTQRNLPLTRANYQTVASALRQKEGNGFLGVRLRHLAQTKGGHWVFDGARHPDEITELRHLPHTFLLGITAPLPILISRILSRNRSLDQSLTPDQATTLLQKELNGTPDSPFSISACLALADEIIQNTGTLTDFHHALEQTYQKIKLTNPTP